VCGFVCQVWTVEVARAHRRRQREVCEVRAFESACGRSAGRPVGTGSGDAHWAAASDDLGCLIGRPAGPGRGRSGRCSSRSGRGVCGSDSASDGGSRAVRATRPTAAVKLPGHPALGRVAAEPGGRSGASMASSPVGRLRFRPRGEANGRLRGGRHNSFSTNLSNRLRFCCSRRRLNEIETYCGRCGDSSESGSPFPSARGILPPRGPPAERCGEAARLT
jgi:hypothetical protein